MALETEMKCCYSSITFYHWKTQMEVLPWRGKIPWLWITGFHHEHFAKGMLGGMLEGFGVQQ